MQNETQKMLYGIQFMYIQGMVGLDIREVLDRNQIALPY